MNILHSQKVKVYRFWEATNKPHQLDTFMTIILVMIALMPY